MNLFYNFFIKTIYVLFFFFFSFTLFDFFVCLDVSDNNNGGSSFFVFDFLKEKWHNYWSNDPHIRVPSSILPDIFYRTGHPIQIYDAEKYFYISKNFSIFYNKSIIFNVTNYPFFFLKKNYNDFFYYSSFFDLFIYKYYFFLKDNSFSVNIFKQLSYQSSNYFDISNVYWVGFEKFENYFLSNVYSNYFFNHAFDLHSFFYPIYYNNDKMSLKTFFKFSLIHFNFYDYFAFKKKFNNVNHFSSIFGSLFFFEKSFFSFSYHYIFINGLFIIFILIFFFIVYSLIFYFILLFLFFSFSFYLYDIYIEQDVDEYVEFILHFVPSPIEAFFGEQDLTNVVSRWEFPLLLKDDFFDSSVYEHNYLNYILYSNSYILLWSFSLNFNSSRFSFFEQKFKVYSILKYKFEVYNLSEYLEDDAMEDWDFFPFGILLDAFPEVSFYLPSYGESEYEEVYISQLSSVLLDSKKFSSDFLYTDFSDSRDFFFIFENSYKHVLWSRHFTTLWPEQDFANFYYEWDESLDPLLYSYIYSSDFANDFILRYKESFSSLFLSLQESEKSLFFSGDSNTLDEISSREFISGFDFMDEDSDRFELDITATESLNEAYFDLEALKSILIDYDELVEEEPRQDFEDEYILTGYEYFRALLDREFFENRLMYNFNYNELGDFKNYIKNRVLTYEEYLFFEHYDFRLKSEQVRFLDENVAETYSYLRPEVWYKMTNDVFFFYGLIIPLMHKYIKSPRIWSEDFLQIDHLDAFENLLDLDNDINAYPELSNFYNDDYNNFGFMTFNHFMFNEDNTVSLVHLGLNYFIENINSNFNTLKMPPYESYLGVLLLPPQIRLNRDLYILNYLKRKNMFLFFLHLNLFKTVKPVVAFEFSLHNTYILDEFALPEGMSVSGVDNFFNFNDYKTNSNIKEYIEQVEVIEEEDVDLTFWYDLDNDNFGSPFSYLFLGVGVPFFFIGFYSFILYCRF